MPHPFGAYDLKAVPASDDVMLLKDVHDTSNTGTGAGALAKTKQVPVGNLLQSAAPDFARVFTGGHSYASGFGNTEGGERFASRLAMSIGAEEVTYAQTAAVLAQDDGGGNPGGFASVLNGIVPRFASASAYSPRSAAPYLATSPASVFFFGFNDLAYLTSTVATNIAWCKMALRALCCLARAGGYFADTNASCAYNGSGGSHWTANTGTGRQGSPTNHSTTTVNDRVTITVPADFPGGEVDLLTLAKSGGSKWSTVVDGGSAQVLDGTSSAFGSNSGRSNLVVQRLTGLTAGTHTIVMTLIAIDGSATAVFDSWLIAAPALPLTFLCTQPAAPGAPFTVGGAAHSPVTATDMTSLNTAITALNAEFTDGLVLTADVAAYFAAASGNVASTSPNSLYVSDGLHFNTAGHGVAARCVRDAIRSAPSPAAARFTSAGLLMRQVQENGATAAWPNGGEPALAANWTASTGSPPTGFFSKGPGGRVELNLVLTRTGTPTAGEVIFNLGTSGYAPAAEVMLFALSWNPAFTTATPGIIGVRPDNDVVWYAGDPTTLLECFGSYNAGAPGF